MAVRSPAAMTSTSWREEMSSDNVKGLVLALSSSFFIGASFIVKKKGLKKAGASGVRAGLCRFRWDFVWFFFFFLGVKVKALIVISEWVSEWSGKSKVEGYGFFQILVWKWVESSMWLVGKHKLLSLRVDLILLIFLVGREMQVLIDLLYNKQLRFRMVMIPVLRMCVVGSTKYQKQVELLPHWKSI